MWAVFSLEFYLHLDLGFLGILPRTVSGLIGIFTAPLIHGDTGHLMSNTLPLLFLGATLYLFYERIATLVFFQCYFLTNLLVWLFGREFYHIGASGVIYALASFLVFMGIFDRHFRSILISAIVILFYGGLIYGIFPTQANISWESHLFGAIVGLGTAFGISRSVKRRY